MGEFFRKLFSEAHFFSEEMAAAAIGGLITLVAVFIPLVLTPTAAYFVARRRARRAIITEVRRTIQDNDEDFSDPEIADYKRRIDENPRYRLWVFSSGEGPVATVLASQLLLLNRPQAENFLNFFDSFRALDRTLDFASSREFAEEQDTGRKKRLLEVSQAQYRKARKIGNELLRALGSDPVISSLHDDNRTDHNSTLQPTGNRAPLGYSPPHRKMQRVDIIHIAIGFMGVALTLWIGARLSGRRLDEPGHH